MDAQYQLFDRLRPEEYDALEADILKRGVLIPVEKDESGNILDGHHRAEIAEKHHLKYPVVKRTFKTENEKHEHILKVNLCRRHLGELAWGQAFKRLLKVKGVRRGKGGNRRSPRATVALGQVASEVGVPERTAKRRLSLADAFERLPAEQQEKVKAADKPEAALKAAVRERKRKAEVDKLKREADAIDDSAVGVHIGSMQDLLATRPAIDAIITDPPYSKDFLPLYADLARLAKDQKKEILVAVLCGQSYLPEIIEAMTAHLTYRWTMAYLTPGGQAVQLWDRKVNTFWKPVLLFGPTPNWIGDVIKSEVNDKRFHNWGQSESGMADLVEKLTKPGETVCDPFMGAGTTGVACAALARKFIGCDLDADNVKKAKARISKELQRCKAIFMKAS